MSKERILYPCYFDASLMRREGRRVPRSMAVKGPTLPDLEKALKKVKVQYRLEGHHHPAVWVKGEGRAVVVWEESKETLLKKVARNLEARK
jgi:signal recognition particle subunit SRP19